MSAARGIRGSTWLRLAALPVLLLAGLSMGRYPAERTQGPLKVTWDWSSDELTFTIEVIPSSNVLAEVAMPVVTGPGVAQLDAAKAQWRLTHSGTGWLGATEKADHVAALYSVFWGAGTFPVDAVASGLWKEVLLLKAFEEVSGTGVNPADSMGVLRGFASMIDTVTRTCVGHLTGRKGIPLASGDTIEVRIPAAASAKGRYKPLAGDRFSIRYTATSMDAFFAEKVEASWVTKGFDASIRTQLGRKTVGEVFSHAQAAPNGYGIVPGSVLPMANTYVTFDLLIHPDRLYKAARVYTTTPTLDEVIALPSVTRTGEVADALNADTSSKGLLDIIFCIDKSGSMADDIEAVKTESGQTLTELGAYVGEKGISTQIGLISYTRHDEANWLQVQPLTDDTEQVRKSIAEINVTDVSLGKGGNEDMYGAMMYAMDQRVGGKAARMGWRDGAAKILIPIGDEPPDDPDWEKRTLDDVARVARNLDPVHIYPVILPKQGPAFLDPTVRAMERIAAATGGQVIRVARPEDLPKALVSTIKLAVRRHRNEVWRRDNPPYVLYGVIGAIVGVMLLALLGLVIRGLLRRPPQEGAPSSRG